MPQVNYPPPNITGQPNAPKKLTDRPLFGALIGAVLSFGTYVVSAWILSLFFHDKEQGIEFFAGFALFLQFCYILPIGLLLAISKVRRDNVSTPTIYIDIFSWSAVGIAALLPFLLLAFYFGFNAQVMAAGLMLQLVYTLPIVLLRRKSIKEHLSPTRLGLSFMVTVVVAPFLLTIALIFLLFAACFLFH